MTTFEVGKKYVSDLDDPILKPVECLYITPNGNVLVKDSTAGEFLLQRKNLGYWKEYKEPLKGEKWITVYKISAKNNMIYSYTFPDEIEARAWSKKWVTHFDILAIKKVEWVEGEGLQ
jgi:hypothetical protein